MVFIFNYSNGKVNIQKLIFLGLLIIFENIYINSLEISSVYPHCLILSNKNLLIVHKTGFSIYDSSLEDSIFDYAFENDDILSNSVEGATISIFQETESTKSYTFVLAKNILYIIPSLENVSIVRKDLNQYLLDLTGFTFYYYTFLFYKYDNEKYYFFIIYSGNEVYENGIILNLFSFDCLTEEVSLVNTITYKDSDSGTVHYISNRGVTCQIMNSNTYGNILVCFYKIDYPVEFKVAAFTVDSGNNIVHLEDINISSSNNENKQVYIKSSISNDKKKALICYSAYDPNDYSKFISFCTTFDIDSLTLGNEKQYDDNCGSSPDFINTFYFDETKEFVFICKRNDDSTVKYKIVKYDSDLKEIDINSQDEEYLTYDNCYYIYSFALIYNQNQYILISDSLCGSNDYIIKTNTLPEYYSASQSSSNYINSVSILKSTTIVKDSFRSSISSILKTSIPSTFSSSSPISTIFFSSINNPSTSIPTNIFSSTNPSYYISIKSSEIKTNVITNFLSTSHISSTGIQKTSSLYSSLNSIPSSTLIVSSKSKSTNFIPNYSSSIITSAIPASISSSSNISKIKSTMPIYTTIPSSSYDSFKSSLLLNPTSDLKSKSFSTSVESFPSSTSFIKE